MKGWLALLFLGTEIFFLAGPVFCARSITISSDKTTIFGDEVLTIYASPSGFASDEAIFIKGAFYLDGSTNYFGYSQKEANWIKNSQTATDQPQVIIANWDNTLRVKVDFSDSGYKGEGDYRFKLGFYYLTSGGNLSSVNWSSPLESFITINEPDPTPTATPLPTSTPTPTKTPTPTPTTIISQTTTIPGEVLSESVTASSSQSEIIEDLSDLSFGSDSSISLESSFISTPASSSKSESYSLIIGTTFILVGGIGLILRLKYSSWSKKSKDGLQQLLG